MAGRKLYVATPEVLEKIVEFRSKGFSEEQTAYSIGVCKQTLINMKKRQPEVAEAMEKGKQLGIATVANTLFEKATVDKDTTSMIFFLKNRDPARWEDVQKRELYGNKNKDAIESKTQFNINFV